VTSTTPLFLSITVERDWVGGVVGKAPWIEELAGQEGLEELSKEQYEMKKKSQSLNPTSPHYVAPGILPDIFEREPFYDHPHAGVGGEKLSMDRGSNRT